VSSRRHFITRDIDINFGTPGRIDSSGVELEWFASNEALMIIPFNVLYQSKTM
jgi:hypothetical protein